MAGVLLLSLVLLNAGPANTAEWLEAAVVKVEDLLEGVSRPHGEGGQASGQPDEDDHQAGRLLALLLSQRFDDGLVSVDTYRHQGPHRDVHLQASRIGGGTGGSSTYRQSLHEGAELTHELRQIPPLNQSCAELEGNTEESEDNVRQGEVGDIEISDGLHPPGDQDHVHHQRVTDDGAHLE